jgi:hypothetical protein
MRSERYATRERVAHKKWSGPLRRVELDPEPPVKSGRPAPAFRLSRREPKSAAGHAHGPSDPGTRRFSIGSKDRRVQHLRCRPTPNFILAKTPQRRGRTAGKSCGSHTPRVMRLSAAKCGHSFLFPQEAKYVYATSSPSAASIGVSRNRGNNALGNGARSDRRCVQWSRRACRIHGLKALAPEGWGVAPVFHELASDGGLRFLVGGAVLPLRAGDTTQPIAGPIVCKRRMIEPPPPWIRRALPGRRPRFAGPLT